jgi:hypothetical protein
MPQSMMNFEEMFSMNVFLIFALIIISNLLKLVIIGLNCFLFSFQYPIMIYLLTIILTSLYGLLIAMIIFLSIIAIIDMIF